MPFTSSHCLSPPPLFVAIVRTYPRVIQCNKYTSSSIRYVRRGLGTVRTGFMVYDDKPKKEKGKRWVGEEGRGEEGGEGRGR